MIRTKFNSFYHYCYLTTNLLEPSKKYVGDHTTKNLERDTYLGSGIELQEDIKKLGRWNFSKIILDFYPTRLEASLAQAVFIKLYKTHWSQGGYNANWSGGLISEGEKSPKTRQKLRLIVLNRTPELRQRVIDSVKTTEHRQRQRENYFKRTPAQIQKAIETHQTPQFRQKQRENYFKRTPEQKERHRNSLLTENHRQKSKETRSKWPVETCIYCGKKGKGVQFKRYHFDNCKKNPNYIVKPDTRKILICPHCDFQGKNFSAMVQWHFDNCLQNPNHPSRNPQKPRNLSLKTCPHCGLQGRGSNMIRYHFGNCKLKL
jgi:hypothetical protein